MFLKKCPFCDSLPSISKKDDNLYILECFTCKKNGINISIESTLDNIKTLWNSRINSFDMYSIGKSEYGYLIMPNGDVIKCNEPHPREILNYLGIFNEFNDFDYENICKKIGILRICEHMNCIMIDIPFNVKKEQIDKCISLLHNYENYNNFHIYKSENEKMVDINSLNDCILELDAIK